MEPKTLFHSEDETPRRTLNVPALLVFVLTFAVAVTAFQLFGAHLPAREPFIEVVSDKYAHLDAHADDYDVMFLGTSHLYRSVDPVVVDSVLATRGHTVRSLNMGVPSLSILETRRLFDRLERLQPRRLQVVVIEPFFQHLRPGNWNTDRALATHDLASTRFMVDYTLQTSVDDPWVRRDAYREAGAHVLCYLGRSLGLGRLARPLFPDIHLLKTRAFAAPDFSRGGFLPLDAETDAQFLGRARYFANHRDEAAWLMAETEAPDWDFGRLGDARVAALRAMVERIRDLGATPVFMVGPAYEFELETAAFLARVESDFADVPVMNLVNGMGYEEVYHLHFWHDMSHVNREGAQVFSRRVGVDLAAVLDAAGRED